MNPWLKFIAFIALSLLSVDSAGQNPTEEKPKEEKKYGIQFKGFVKSDYWYDSRQIIASREDLFLIVPANKLADENGNDINAHPSFNFSAITSRITGIITGPDAFGAKTSGLIEADFSGVSNNDINGLRLRHAIGKLRWNKTELMFGQFWHPMFVTEVFPVVISLNTGAPFQPFIRNPQISFTRFFDRQFSLNLTVLTQRDHSSDGPAGVVPNYMKNALIPNAHIQLQQKTNHHVWGIAADYKVLQPRLVTDSNSVTKITVESYALMGYYKYVNKDFFWSFKSIYGQNLYEHLMFGGYAVRSVDPQTRRETYTPTNHLFLWSNIGYGNSVRLLLFAGFAKNLGTTNTNTGKYYARGKDIAYAYRLSPSLSFVSDKVQISTELECTAAAHGQPDQKGIVKNAKEVRNFRLLVTLFYFF